MTVNAGQSHITPPDGNSALGKGVTVLSAILNAEKPPSLNDLAEMTGFPRQTVFRVVRQLEDTLLVSRSPDEGRYMVGPNLMALATDALATFAKSAPIRATLAGLVHDIGETCNLAVIDRGAVVYIERVECDWPLRLQIGTGSRAPLHATAIGKLLLAYMPARKRKRLLGISPLEAFTPRSITDPARLEAQFRAIRRQGYACNDEENTLGLIGIAVPIFDTKGRAIAGISVHAPAARLSISKAISKVGRLNEAARQIEAAMREQQRGKAEAS